MKTLAMLLVGLFVITVIEVEKLPWRGGNVIEIYRICIDGYEYVMVDRQYHSPSITQSFTNYDNVTKRCENKKGGK